MASWNDLLAHLKNRYPIRSEGEGYVLIELGVGDEDGRTRTVEVAQGGRIGDSDWAEISTIVCLASELDPAEALRRNDRLPVGFLASDGDVVRLKYRLPLLGAQPSVIDVPLEAVAVCGDELGPELTDKDLR